MADPYRAALAYAQRALFERQMGAVVPPLGPIVPHAYYHASTIPINKKKTNPSLWGWGLLTYPQFTSSVSYFEA
jgi:hypothetical protein